jgi:arylformamidase
VQRGLSLSGLYELASVMRTPFVQPSLRLTQAQVDQASPAWLPAPHHATFMSVAGADESEEFIRHNHLIQKAWGKKVVTVCEDLPGLNHFSIVEALTQPGHRLQQLAAQLVR